MKTFEWSLFPYFFLSHLELKDFFDEITLLLIIHLYLIVSAPEGLSYEGVGAAIELCVCT